MYCSCNFCPTTIQHKLKNLMNKCDRSVIYSIVFLIISVLSNSIAIQYTTERIVQNHLFSNKTKLPDIFLDVIQPDFTFFSATEFILGFLGIASFINLFFFQNQWIILKRYAVCFAISYTIRVLLFTVTILPVPHTYTGCPYENNVLHWYILKPLYRMLTLGMTGSNLGCGDYIYSGHTSSLTFLCFFGRDYFYFKSKIISFLLWMINFIGMIFIIKSHIHYTVDVILGFIVATMIYSSYHSFILMVKIRNTDSLSNSNCMNFDGILQFNRIYAFFEKSAIPYHKSSDILNRIDYSIIDDDVMMMMS